MAKDKKCGMLRYNHSNERYGVYADGKWVDDGLHCGECLEVMIDNEWVQTRIEMTFDGEWYLVGTKLKGCDLVMMEARMD